MILSPSFLYPPFTLCICKFCKCRPYLCKCLCLFICMYNCSQILVQHSISPIKQNSMQFVWLNSWSYTVLSWKAAPQVWSSHMRGVLCCCFSIESNRLLTLQSSTFWAGRCCWTMKKKLRKGVLAVFSEPKGLWRHGKAHSCHFFMYL